MKKEKKPHIIIVGNEKGGTGKINNFDAYNCCSFEKGFKGVVHGSRF